MTDDQQQEVVLLTDGNVGRRKYSRICGGGARSSASKEVLYDDAERGRM